MSPYFLRDIVGDHISPIVLASPHSGREYPAEFLANVLPDQMALARAEDRFVDRLVMPAAEKYDLPLIHARWGRTYLDLNRDPADLDSAILTGAPQFGASARVKAGLGILPRIATPGVPLYGKPMALSEAHKRIREVHEPYYGKLGALLARARAANGFAILIDCHSMPTLPRYSGRQGADIVLGDRHGQSSDARITRWIEAAFRHDFQTARNVPYAGGFATGYFGVPAMGTYAVQLEIDRSLYLDPATLEPSENFAAMSDHFSDMIATLGERLASSFEGQRMAAE